MTILKTFKIAKMKKGDIVKISRKSGYWKLNTPDNPRDMEGKIIEVSKTGSITVRWSNGRNNGYSEHDLELFDQSEKEQIKNIYKEFSNLPDIDKIIENTSILDVKMVSECESLSNLGLEDEDVKELMLNYIVLLNRLIEERKLIMSFLRNETIKENAMNLDEIKEYLDQQEASFSSIWKTGRLTLPPDILKSIEEEDTDYLEEEEDDEEHYEENEEDIDAEIFVNDAAVKEALTSSKPQKIKYEVSVDPFVMDSTKVQYRENLEKEEIDRLTKELYENARNSYIAATKVIK